MPPAEGHTLYKKLKSSDSADTESLQGLKDNGYYEMQDMGIEEDARGAEEDNDGTKPEEEELRPHSFEDDIYDSEDILPREDDPTLPALTFRAWVIGSFFCIILTNTFAVSPFIAVILSYPMGLFMAHVLPTRKFNTFGFEWSLNPGPFNHKEHALIFVFASTGACPCYALFNIVGQKYILKQPLDTAWALVFAFVTQCFGYALAGLCRSWIIVPILYYTNAFGNDMSLGAGKPLEFYLGTAINSPALFANNGTRILAKSLIQVETDAQGIPRYDLDEAAYDAVKPIRITTLFAISYATSFMVFAAALVHVGLWYGKDILQRFRVSMAELDKDDVHAKLMSAYPDVPDYWYYGLLIVNVILGILVCEYGGFDLPWWGVLLALALAGVSMIPLGIIQAITGQPIGLNVMSEFLIGWILPGRFVSVVSFKTLSYMAMAQGLSLVQDLKLSHYMKIPPRAMFTVQLVSTIGAMVINVFTAFFIYDKMGDRFDNPSSGWSAVGYRIFFNAGAIWGAIGPSRFFGPSSPYFPLLLGFVFGAILPVVFWAGYKITKNDMWKLVNIPVLAVNPSGVGTTRSDLVSPILVSVLVNQYIRNKYPSWWKRFALVMSAAFDTGAAITVSIIFFAVTMNNVTIPWHIFHRYDMEGCAPASVLEMCELPGGAINHACR
ncbi:hypothetical protein HDV05_003833 [Chytridiales sp. JEL 0842]|nr:hypothetical protein HDV05_003833 [Chytridiales sp. JEL 0842]